MITTEAPLEEMRACAGRYASVRDVRAAAESLLKKGDAFDKRELAAMLGIPPVQGQKAEAEYGADFSYRSYERVCAFVDTGVSRGDMVKRPPDGKTSANAKYVFVRKFSEKPCPGYDAELYAGMREFLRTSGPVTYDGLLRDFGLDRNYARYVKLMGNDGVLELAWDRESDGELFIGRMFGRGCRRRIFVDATNPVNMYRLAGAMVGAISDEGLYPWHLGTVERQISRLEEQGVPRYAADVARRYCAAAAEYAKA